MPQLAGGVREFLSRPVLDRNVAAHQAPGPRRYRVPLPREPGRGIGSAQPMGLSDGSIISQALYAAARIRCAFSIASSMVPTI